VSDEKEKLKGKKKIVLRKLPPLIQESLVRETISAFNPQIEYFAFYQGKIRFYFLLFLFLSFFFFSQTNKFIIVNQMR